MRKKLAIFLSLLLLISAFSPVHAASATCPGNPYGTSHIWEYASEVPSTCLTGGSITYRCPYCGEEMTEYWDKLPHSYGDWYTIQEATCYSTGVQERACSYCGITEQRTIPQTPHTFGEWVVTEEATCAKEGTQTASCQICGAVQTQALPKKPHTFGEWKVTMEATDHSAGKKERACTECGTVETEDLYPDGTLRNGSRGGAVVTLQERLIDEGFLGAGGADGIYGNGTAGAVRQYQEAHGLAPDGIAWPQTLAMINHVFGDWEMIYEPSWYYAGKKQRTCIDCGYTETKEVLPAGILRNGSRGEGVFKLQAALNEQGYDCGVADGAFGAMTENAVRSYQEEMGFDVDGIAWPGLQIMLYDGPLPQLEGYVLDVTITVIDGDKDTYQAGDTITFEAEVTNSGSKDLYNWQICEFGENNSSGMDGIYGVIGSGDILRAGETRYADPVTYTVTEQNVRLEGAYVAWIARAELPSGEMLMTDDAGFMLETMPGASEVGEEQISTDSNPEDPWPEPTEEPTPEPTATNTPTPEPTATNTPTPEPTATNTPTPTPEPTATNTPTPTPEPTATNTPTPEPTATNTPAPEPTATNTPTPEPTATNTPTPEPTATNTPTPEPTATNTPTPTPEPTATNTPTPEPTATNTPTPTPEPTEEPEITERKDTGSFFANLFSFLTPGEKETGLAEAPTPEPTEAPTPEPTATNTPTPEPTATNTPTPVPVPTNTPRPVSSGGSDIIGFFGGMFSFLGR